MNALHPLTILTWFLWGFFMGLGWLAANTLCAVVARNAHYIWSPRRKVGPLPPMPVFKGQRWEVMGLDFDPELGLSARTGLLNDYGAGGWELVSVNDNSAWLKRVAI